MPKRTTDRKKRVEVKRGAAGPQEKKQKLPPTDMGREIKT